MYLTNSPQYAQVTHIHKQPTPSHQNNEFKEERKISDFKIVKGRSRRLRPKAHILDDPLGNPNDDLGPS